ncbi:hypothetical protein MAPG_04862 [Magnaporthiopsis poae ATCC 64411]|uniref:CCHC-type domain-containing protein n=1 Tax=Magnaporthiopsis poae (strain ATCC 64411 / 73-15) TaxID=644358 RepID=A0A0C4DXV5_MAGP6|nr:hypothetical protein MAPG_04862 [Magnaporthiopsis poae ATCC 64411]
MSGHGNIQSQDDEQMGDAPRGTPARIDELRQSMHNPANQSRESPLQQAYRGSGGFRGIAGHRLSDRGRTRAGFAANARLARHVPARQPGYNTPSDSQGRGIRGGAAVAIASASAAQDRIVLPAQTDSRISLDKCSPSFRANVAFTQSGQTLESLAATGVKHALDVTRTRINELGLDLPEAVSAVRSMVLQGKFKRILVEADTEDEEITRFPEARIGSRFYGHLKKEAAGETALRARGSCGACRKPGHVLADCVAGSITGDIVGCPLCNDGTHLIEMCPAFENLSLAEQHELIIRRRGRKQPIRTRVDWTARLDEYVREWEARHGGFEKMRMPMTQQFAREFRAAHPQLISAYDYLRDPGLAEDPATKDMAAVKQKQREGVVFSYISSEEAARHIREQDLERVLKERTEKIKEMGDSMKEMEKKNVETASELAMLKRAEAQQPLTLGERADVEHEI